MWLMMIYSNLFLRKVVRTVFWICFFDRTDGCNTTIIVTGTEAAYQNFSAADLVLIQRIVLDASPVFAEVSIAALSSSSSR